MGMYDLAQKKATKCDNKATIEICIGDNGVVFIFYLLGGKWQLLNGQPYCCGCHQFKADIGTDIMFKPMPDDGFKSINPTSRFKMKTANIKKTFNFRTV